MNGKIPALVIVMMALLAGGAVYYLQVYAYYNEIDASAVTAVDQAGIALCLTAQSRHGVEMGSQSECFAVRWQEAATLPGRPGVVA